MRRVNRTPDGAPEAQATPSRPAPGPWYWRYAARSLFYPSVAWNVMIRAVRRLARWNWVDDDVLLGALPRRRDLTSLAQLGVTGVVNMCEEFRGHEKEQRAAGIEQLWLPTIDFTPPALTDIREAVDFIESHRSRGGKVYVHCKAGRGRGATIALCYLIRRYGWGVDRALQELRKRRPLVVRSLANRRVVHEFAAGTAVVERSNDSAPV